MAAFTEKSILADKLLALAGTIDAVKDEDYSEDATELLDADDARHLREAAAILETAVVTPSLRHYFAAAALQGLCANAQIVLQLHQRGQSEEEVSQWYTRAAVRAADAVLAELEKGGAR